jgi:hypothetical protein
MLVATRITCPYCGEVFDTTIDISAGSQEYIEDCQICCRPIVFRTTVGHEGNLIGVEAYRDDD